MSSDELYDREKKAGNEADSINPGQKDSDVTFSRNTSNHENIEGYDRSADGLDDYDEKEFGKRKSSGYTDAHGDKVKANYNADDPEPDLANTVKDKEESGGSTFRYAPSPDSKMGSFLGKLKGHAKNYGPSAGIVGLLIGGFGSASVLLLPASLLVALEKAVTNDGSDSTRTNILLRRAYMGSMLGKGDCSSKIKCKMTTMSEQQKTRWEKLGFKVDSTQEGERHKITAITSPDGKTKMTNGKEFNTWAESSLENRRVANRVVSVRAAFFQNAKFQKVLDKYKLSKSKLLKASRDKDKQKRTEAINKSFDENAESSPDEDTRKASVKAKTDEAKTKAGTRFKKGLARGSGIVTAVGTACMAYNTTRLTIATVKAKWIYDLVKFAYPFIQAAAQIEDQGNIEPEVVENLADRLTWYQRADTADTDEEKEKVDLTAMDSQGLQMAIYGDTTALQQFTKQYTTGMVTAAVMGSQIVHSIESMLGGKEEVRDTCRAAGTAGLLTSVTCAAGPLALAACGGAIAALLFFGDEIIAKAVDLLAGPAIEAIANAKLSSNLKGVDAGNALAAGVGLMLSSSSMGYGLRPAGGKDSSEGLKKVKQFISATDNLNYKYGEELARYEARDTPFDIYNQYSFAGQVVSSLNPYRSNDNALYGQFINMFSVVTSSFSRITPSASALYSQPSNMTLEAGSAKNRIDKCEDQDMKDIGAVCDWSGRMIGYTTPEVIAKSAKQATGEENMISQTIDYMLSNGFIDEDGKATGDKNFEGAENDDEKDDYSYEYIKYKNYCTEDRVDPLGTSSKSVEEGSAKDQLWYTGERCLGKDDADQQMLDNFAIYFNYCESQVPTADEVENCWGTQAAVATPNTGDWVIPTSGPCLSGYGPRGGANHAGMDISPSSGTPIVAPTSMKITHVGDKGDRYGTSVTATATDGSGYSFRFAHMIAGSPTVSVGQEVSKGQEIGQVGSTGDSSGPHLHFEIYPQGSDPMSYSGATDPIPVLADHGVSISCQS